MPEIRVEKPRPQESLPSKAEQPLVPEKAAELPKPIPAEKVQPQSAERQIPAGIGSPAAQDWQARRAAAIDSILSEGLNEIYLKMKPEDQKRFRASGEATVAKINILLSQTKLKVNKIVDLIRRWLKLIPGVNKFFLEQEVKIKADKIMKIRNKF